MSRKVPNLMVTPPSPRGSKQGMRLPGHLHPERIHGRARGEEEGAEIRSAEGEVGGHLGRTDDAEPRSVRREDPRAAGAGAVDATLDVHLHAVRHAVRLV